MIGAGRSQLELCGAEVDAVIVDGDRPRRLILREKASYVPCWDLGNDAWFTPEWLEVHSPEDPYCYKPVMDKDCRYSRAELPKTDPARAVVCRDCTVCDSLYRVFLAHYSTHTIADIRQYLPDGGVPVRPTGRAS